MQDFISNIKNIINNLENRCDCKHGTEQEKIKCQARNVEKTVPLDVCFEEKKENYLLMKKNKKVDMYGREEYQFFPGCSAPEYVKYPLGLHPMIPYPRPPKIIELKGSDLIKGCACLKRNGLQTDCALKKCMGNIKCTYYPTPVCEPSGLGLPRVRSSMIKKSDNSCELSRAQGMKGSFKKKSLTDIQIKKIANRRRIQEEAEKELYDKVQKEVHDRIICKRVDCNYIKRNPRCNKKIQTELFESDESKSDEDKSDEDKSDEDKSDEDKSDEDENKNQV